VAADRGAGSVRGELAGRATTLAVTAGPRACGGRRGFNPHTGLSHADHSAPAAAHIESSFATSPLSLSISLSAIRASGS
jgi:hypothetical protein